MKINKPFDMYAWRHLFAPTHLRNHDNYKAMLRWKYKNPFKEWWKEDKEDM